MSERNYVIVGGSSGIGLGLVRRLLADGGRVTVFSRQPRELAGLAGVTHVELDVTQAEIDKTMLPEAITGLAYCPGSINLKSFRGLTPSAFREDFELNVVGAVKTIQAALPGLKQAKQSAVLLFSTVAVGQGMPMHASIAASKGAIEGLTRTLAAELSPEVRVNCIAPALIDTPLTARFFSSDDKTAALAQRYPLKRTGTVTDIAGLGQFLLSESSGWITGQVFGVDGGMSTLKM